MSSIRLISPLIIALLLSLNFEPQPSSPLFRGLPDCGEELIRYSAAFATEQNLAQEKCRFSLYELFPKNPQKSHFLHHDLKTNYNY